MTMFLEQKIKNCLARHPDWEIKRIGNSTGARHADILAVKEGRPLPALGITSFPSQAGSGVIPPASDSGLISLDKVSLRYDIKAAIYRELGAVPPGKLISEAELYQRAGGRDRYKFNRTIENNASEFKPLRIKLRLDDSGDGKWYWGDGKTIASALQIRDA